MIRNKTDLEKQKSRLKSELAALKAHRSLLKNKGFTKSQIETATLLTEKNIESIRSEIANYRRIKLGSIGKIETLSDIGRTLIELRLARGMSQNELAKLLGIPPSQVSRDEKNAYQGVTLNRAHKTLEALQVKLTIRSTDLVLPKDTESQVSKNSNNKRNRGHL